MSGVRFRPPQAKLPAIAVVAADPARQRDASSLNARIQAVIRIRCRDAQRRCRSDRQNRLHRPLNPQQAPKGRQAMRHRRLSDRQHRPRVLRADRLQRSATAPRSNAASDLKIGELHGHQAEPASAVTRPPGRAARSPSASSRRYPPWPWRRPRRGRRRTLGRRCRRQARLRGKAAGPAPYHSGR